MTEIYQCDYCNAQFDFKLECDIHEKKCRMNNCPNCKFLKTKNIEVSIKRTLTEAKNFDCKLGIDINEFWDKKPLCKSFIRI